MKDSFFKELINTLKTNPEFVSENGDLLKNVISEKANKLDSNFLELLLSNDILKERLFKNVNGNLIFDKVEFSWMIKNKKFLPSSYTKYINKIMLVNDNDDSIKATDDVVLSFPYKDCVLEADSTKEDEKRREIFFNETLMKNDIDTLLSPKILESVKKIEKNSEEDSVVFDNDNLFINGNNLIGMYSLLPKFENKIKCMYWDILYNTQSDNVPYNDNFKHSSWLVMMKNRLEVGYRLLSNDGAIFIQCDGNEMHYLKVLCDEIFKRDNYLATITCRVKAPSGVASGSQMIFDCSEYILVYARNKQTFTYNDITEEAEIVDENSKTKDFYKYILEEISYDNLELIKELDGEKIYRVPKDNYKITEMKDFSSEAYYNNYKKVFRTAALSGGREKIVKAYLDTVPDANNNLYVYEHVPTKGKRANQVCMDLIYKKGGVLNLENFCTTDDKNKKVIKLQHITSIFFNDWWQGIASEGSTDLKNGKKPERLIKTILDMATNENDYVLDAYFGSGTTGAVAMKMNRRFIGIEQLKSHVEKANDRLKRVINGDTSGISNIVHWNGGGSYIYCELSKYNQKYVDKIVSASSESLNDLWKEIVENALLNNYIDVEDLPNNYGEFTTLDDVSKKKVLINILDKNLLYTNYSDIDSEDVEISDSDKNFNKDFYEV